MKVVRNKTRKPIRVPLGKGKVLFLGPGKTGNVSPQAAEREAFVKLIDQGEIELLSDGEAGGGEGAQSGRVHEATHGNPQRRIQRTGDR
jgi:hypothetical protein